MSVGGVEIPAGEGWEGAPPYHGARGTTFEGRWTPELLAPAENVPLPWGRAQELGEHAHRPADGLPCGYAPTEGTSLAGAIVLGAVACLWQVRADWTAAQIRQALRVTSRRRQRWRTLRAGLVDVALAARIPLLPPTPGRPSPFERYRGLAESSLTSRLDRIRDEDAAEVPDVILSFLPGPSPDPALSSARDLLTHQAPQVRAAALCLLAAHQDAIDPAAVSRLLDDGDPRVRAAALHALRVSSPSWTEAIERRMSGLP
jgi:serine protease AprX